MNRYKYIDEKREHLHTLDGKPLIGSSTAKGIIGKGDGLIQWAANCAVDEIKNYAAISRTGGVRYFEVKESLLEEACTAWKRTRDSAAKVGTARHGVLESYVRYCLNSTGGEPQLAIHEAHEEIEMFIKWAFENVERFFFTEAHCYHEDLWVGGIADLGLVLKDGRRAVCDHKSSKAAYFDQFVQCAIYDVLLSHSGGLDKEGNKLFDWQPADGYIVFPFRSEPFTPEYRWDAERYREAARQTIELYKLSLTN